jgi:hypothetical protein
VRNKRVDHRKTFLCGNINSFEIFGGKKKRRSKKKGQEIEAGARNEKANLWRRKNCEDQEKEDKILW